jgi:hypothetical protein
VENDMKKTTNHSLFMAVLKAEGLDRCCLAEYRFHPDRKWRFDYAFFTCDLDYPFREPGGVALEIEGAVWIHGRHTRGSGFVNDMEKYNEAACLGWRIIRVQPKELCTLKTVEMIRRVLNA